MKKVFALLLALTMVCAFLPMMASAADVSYDFSVITYHAGDDYDMLAEEGAFGLTISANGAKFSGGSIAIAYNTEKVTPGYIGRKGFVAATEAADIVDTTAEANAIGVTMGTQFLNTTKGYIVLNVTKNTSIDWANVTGNDKLLTLIFAPVDADSFSIDNVAGIFSAIPANDQYLVDCQVKANGGAGVFKDNNSAIYSTDQGTLDMNFPGSAEDPTVAATNVVLDKTAATITTIGETVTLTATVKGANDANATNQNVTWTTSDDKVATVANGVVTAVADGTATITATSEDGSFTATCAITVDADWEAAPADKTEWKNGFEFKGQDGTTKTDNTVKKLVIFGKNSTTTELAAKSYGVKIGINEYKGVLPVPAGSSWAIIILDENGQKVALDNYSYTAFVGDKTVFSGNVNAQ